MKKKKILLVKTISLQSLHYLWIKDQPVISLIQKNAIKAKIKACPSK